MVKEASLASRVGLPVFVLSERAHGPHPNARSDTEAVVGDTHRRMTEESMTPDLAELSRQMADAMSSGDVDAMMSFFAMDAVMLGATGSQNGAAAIRELWEGWLGAFEELHVEVDELLDLGNGVSFAVSIQVARPRGSSGELRQRLCFATVRGADGLIVRWESYPDSDEARSAAERLAQERG
jgi:ketosteroid isomerase-like protein